MSQALTQKRKDQISNEVLKLRRQPENLKCVDCSNRNCSYVCTNFNTFICSECAGLYRNHCFRVKSCTVATFTEKELENLRNSGGNEASNRRYMARWKKKSEAPIPKQGDLKALNDFIHRKYVKKEWFKERRRKKKKKKDDESKTKHKAATSKVGKQSNENQKFGRASMDSESAAPKVDDEWDVWGEKANVSAKAPPVAKAPKGDFLSDFSFDAAPTVAAKTNSDSWNPFGSKPSAVASPEPTSVGKSSVDLMTQLISDIQVTKPQDDFGSRSMESHETPPAPKPAVQTPKPVYNDPFLTLLNNVPANQPVAQTSPTPQVSAAPQPLQLSPPMQYPMFVGAYPQQYGMAQPAAKMNPYPDQYNMPAQQPMNPFGAQIPSNPEHTLSQNIPYVPQASAQMNQFGYQVPTFDITRASQVSQDNPFS